LDLVVVDLAVREDRRDRHLLPVRHCGFPLIGLATARLTRAAPPREIVRGNIPLGGRISCTKCLLHRDFPDSPVSAVSARGAPAGPCPGRRRAATGTRPARP